MKAFKYVVWLLRGSPRCRFCGRPLRSVAAIKSGYGAGCVKKFKGEK